MALEDLPIFLGGFRPEPQKLDVGFRDPLHVLSSPVVERAEILQPIPGRNFFASQMVYVLGKTEDVLIALTNDGCIEYEGKRYALAIKGVIPLQLDDIASYRTLEVYSKD